MERVKGVNLGNWLVLEKWMLPSLFEGADTHDEIGLYKKLEPEVLAARVKAHRETYITEEDFAAIAAHGLNLVRLPVPYFVFGDCPPYLGCIDYVDRAMDWAEKRGVQVLVDLHTVPGCQNGYDNGGRMGVCKWHKDPEGVEFALTVLERLARRYGMRPGLYGIEVVNEPISALVWLTSPTRKRAEDPEEAKGSSYVPLSFLKKFYVEAYWRLRAILPPEKVIVFHDGFRLGAWKDFFVRAGMENVVLDTHIYIYAMECFVPIHKPWVYKLYTAIERRKIERAQRYTPVIVGEWCIGNLYAEATGDVVDAGEHARARRAHYLEVEKIERDAWSVAAGTVYWTYRFDKDLDAELEFSWMDGWDLCRCWQNGWLAS